jgi:hypothetical protein
MPLANGCMIQRLLGSGGMGRFISLVCVFATGVPNHRLE